jgi:hypothetical protein
MSHKATEPAYTTRPLNADTWVDFAKLVEANNGVWGGCWCMGFHPEGVGKDRTASQNREAKHEHVRKGTVHQVLVYDGDHCVGWCQYGPPRSFRLSRTQRVTTKNSPSYRTGGSAAFSRAKGTAAKGSLVQR